MFLFLHKWSRKNFVLASYTYIYNKIYRRTWQDEVIFHRQDPDERSSRRMQPHEKHISLAGKCWTVGRSYWSSNGLDREFALFLRSTPIVPPFLPLSPSSSHQAASWMIFENSLTRYYETVSRHVNYLFVFTPPTLPPRTSRVLASGWLMAGARNRVGTTIEEFWSKLFVERGQSFDAAFPI